MTRQVCYVFFGKSRLSADRDLPVAEVSHRDHSERFHRHESPAVMIVPLLILAVFGNPSGRGRDTGMAVVRFLSERPTSDGEFRSFLRERRFHSDDLLFVYRFLRSRIWGGGFTVANPLLVRRLPMRLSGCSRDSSISCIASFM